MQKKLIALAVAGLMSAPAFAQSNVTIYGVVDFGYKWTGDSSTDGVDSRSALDSGISAGNRLGFKGTEDLGNGLKASFVYETGITGDRSDSGSGLWGGAGSRQSYVALSGGFGTVALGRQYTPAHALLAGNIDPFGFGKGTVASLANVYISPTRLDNLAAYVSPSFGGFSVVAAYTNNAVGDEGVHNDFGNQSSGSDARAWAIAPTYKNGPIYAALNVHQIRVNATGASHKAWDLGGTYDFGVVKIGAVYGVADIEAGGFGSIPATGTGSFPGGLYSTSDVKHKQWALTAAVPVGAAGKVQASYIRRKSEIDGFDDAKVSQWGIGYEHALSKRTALYTAYADINNKGEAKDGGPFAASTADATRAVSDSATGSYQRGFTVGVRHSF